MTDTEIAELFEDQYTTLIHFIASKIGIEEAADLASEAFVRLIAANQERIIEYPTTYLYTIARNAMIDRHRRRQAQQKQEYHANIRSEAERATATTSAPTEAIHARIELGEYMRRAHLTCRNEEALIYAYFWQMSNAQIGTQLGMTPGAAKATLHRSFVKLREAAAATAPAARITNRTTHRVLRNDNEISERIRHESI